MSEKKINLIYLLFKIITDNYKQYKADKTGKRPFYEFNKLPFFGVLLGGALMYFYALYDIKLQNSAALYMGLPFLLALGITLIPKSVSTNILHRSATNHWANGPL